MQANNRRAKVERAISRWTGAVERAEAQLSTPRVQRDPARRQNIQHNLERSRHYLARARSRVALIDMREQKRSNGFVNRIHILNQLRDALGAGIRWFVVYTNTGYERQVLAGLEARGVRAYLPTLIRWVRHARQKTNGESPLFPRYVFVGLPRRSAPSFAFLQGITGVEAVLRNNGAPVSVPEAIICDLVEAEASGEFDETRALPPPKVRPGDLVLITGGAFSGLVAKVKRVPSRTRVQVLLACLGGVSTMNLPIDDVRAA